MERVVVPLMGQRVCCHTSPYTTIVTEDRMHHGHTQGFEFVGGYTSIGCSECDSSTKRKIYHEATKIVRRITIEAKSKMHSIEPLEYKLANRCALMVAPKIFLFLNEQFEKDAINKNAWSDIDGSYRITKKIISASDVDKKRMFEVTVTVDIKPYEIPRGNADEQ